MDIASPRILIVDDRPEHGEAIVRKLWQMGYASLYVEYSDRLVDGDYGPYRGVRLVFMDLDLVGEGRIGDGSRAYADVEASLRKILDESNGPWSLVTWTGHADHSDQLIEHLKERLPDTLKPLGQGVLDKTYFLDDDGVPKDDGRDNELVKRLSGIVGNENVVKCLLDWESNVLKSANDVIAGLSKTAMESGTDTQDHLSALLYELAQAVAGKRIENMDDYAPPLYTVLTTLLSDRLLVVQPEVQSCLSEHIKKPEQSSADFAEWKCQINTMIHFDAGYMGVSCTGAIFEIQDNKNLPHPLDEKPEIVLEKQFLFPKGASDKKQKVIVGQCKLLLIDITPPCDHNQGKADWHRFVLAASIPLSALSNSLEKRFKQAEHIWVCPKFMNAGKDSFVIMVNANLQISLHADKISDYLNTPNGRLREQLMADMTGRIGSHISRIGHLFLATP